MLENLVKYDKTVNPAENEAEIVPSAYTTYIVYMQRKKNEGKKQ